MRAIVWATVVAGALDILSAIVLRGLVNGISATRVLQSVASGVLGRAAFVGNARTAALGVLLHFLIMAVIATLFHVVSRRWSVLTTQWLPSGLAYGAIVYVIMSFVVVPLSAFPGKLVPSLAAFAEGVAVHMICVGMPIAFIVSRWGQSVA